ITKYGVRYMRVDVAGTVNLTSTQAQAMADAMCSDLQTPWLEQEFSSYALWFAQLYDYAKTLANGVHYNADQLGGVTSVAHAISGGTVKSTIGARGQPAGGYRSWLQYARLSVSAAPIYNQCIAQVTNTTATTIEVTVTASSPTGTPTVEFIGVTGSAVRASGPLAGVSSPSGTVWTFTRGAALGGSGEAQFRALFAGNVSDDDLVAIPEQGRDTTYLASRARVIATTATTVTVRYAVADPYPQGTNSATIAYQDQGSGGVTPATGQTVTPASTLTEAANTYVDFVITRPAFATGTARVTFTATAANRVSDSDAVDVPAQEKTAFGPNLSVVPTPGATSYSIAWSGDGVKLQIDGGAVITAPAIPLNATPIVVPRNAPGGADKIYAFTGLKDSQTVSNTVTIPAQSGSTAPSATLVPSLTNNQTDDTVGTVTLSASATNLPAAYTWA